MSAHAGTGAAAAVPLRPHRGALAVNVVLEPLEDLGGGLGVTDPVSGPVVLAIK